MAKPVVLLYRQSRGVMVYGITLVVYSNSRATMCIYATDPDVRGTVFREISQYIKFKKTFLNNEVSNDCIALAGFRRPHAASRLQNPRLWSNIWLETSPSKSSIVRPSALVRTFLGLYSFAPTLPLFCY